MHLNKIIRLFSALALLNHAMPAAAQFYYKDIVVVDQTNNTQKLYTQEKIAKVTLESFEPDNRRSSDLRVSQTVSENFRKLVTVTQTSVSSISVMTSLFDENGRLSEVTDSTTGDITKTVYSYSPDGKLDRLIITTRSLRDPFEKTEEHVWHYNGKGQPEKMLRILEKKDTIQVQFITDSAGRVIEEKTQRTTRRVESVYYYYNDAGLISDIVRFNARAGRLLPDYMFEYDAQGKLVQMINVPNAGGNYVTWLYTYDESGLKTREVAVDKQKQVMGRVEYLYTRSN